MSYTTPNSSHLCVLVHGLWGNPAHLDYLKNSIREKHSEDQLHILVTARHAGNLTYDGVDVGGERVTQEIEDKLEDLARGGHEVKKISIIGYSLGGLVARYAVGLLYSKGWFDRIEPVNFTTFATPHLGVRTPRIGVPSKVWNFLGSRTLSVSGRQMFLIDKFRDTNRPLFSILSDPESIFMRGLSQFKNPSLYANIINDRSVPYYTSMITSTDPYVDLEPLIVNYHPGYEPILVDATNPITLKDTHIPPNFYARGQNFIQRLPMLVFFTIFIPIGASLYLLNSAIQSVQSQRRIRAHESGKTGVDFGLYRIPLIVNEAQHTTDRVFENAANSQQDQFLPQPSVEKARVAATDSASDSSSLKNPQFPALALHPAQVEMIRHLDGIRFKKFPVHIHKATHSHAAIVVRMQQRRFDDGKVVIKHWVENFEI